MATIRELVAKLGFDVDAKPAEKFEQTINGVKNALNTLAVAKGLSVGSRLEDNFLEAQRKISFLAGPQGLGALNDALNMISSTASDVDIAEAMREGIEVTSDPQFTKQMVEFGALMADAFGGSLQSNMQTLIQGALGGNFSALVPSGLFTQQEAEFLSGVNINSVQGKLLIINKLEEKRLKLTKEREKALLTGGVQTDRLLRNIENLGKAIGSFVNPVIGRVLGLVNDLFEAFIGSKAGMALAKIAAIAGGISLVAGAIMSAKVVFGTLATLLSGGFGTALVLSGSLAAAILLIEDAWKTANGAQNTFFADFFRDSPKAREQFNNAILDPWDQFKKSVQENFDTQTEYLSLNFKESVYGKSLAWLIEQFELLKESAADFFSVQGIIEAATGVKYSLGGDSQEGGGNFAGFQGQLGQDLNSVLSGLVPMAPIAQPMGGSIIDQRSATFVVNVNGGNPAEVQRAVEEGARKAGLMDKVRTREQIQLRDTQKLGGN